MLGSVYKYIASEQLCIVQYTFASKTLFSDKTVEIAASTFNKEYESILLMMQTMDITIRLIAAVLCENIDEKRVANRRSFSESG